MGGYKDLIEQHLEQRDEAIDIAVAAKALGRCEFCGAIVANGGDPAEAYRIGNARFTAGQLKTEFDSRRDLTDAIKSAIDEHVLDYCARCDKMRE